MKIAWRHPEGAHEADGLRVWDGGGTVRLHAIEEIDSDTVALLLERCQPGATLEALPELAEVARTIARGTGRRPSSGKSQGELVGLLQVTTAEEHGVHEHRKQLPEADAPPPAVGQRRELLVGRESPGRCVSE